MFDLRGNDPFLWWEVFVFLPQHHMKLLGTRCSCCSPAAASPGLEAKTSEAGLLAASPHSLQSLSRQQARTPSGLTVMADKR